MVAQLIASAWGNLSIIEVIWFLVGCVAAYFSGSNLTGALGDKAAMATDEAKARFDIPELAAIDAAVNGTILQETIRLSKAAAIMITGVAAALTPPSNPHQPITAAGIVITVMVVYIGFAIALASYLAAASRKRIVQVRRDLGGKASKDQH